MKAERGKKGYQFTSHKAAAGQRVKKEWLRWLTRGRSKITVTEMMNAAWGKRAARLNGRRRRRVALASTGSPFPHTAHNTTRTIGFEVLDTGHTTIFGFLSQITWFARSSSADVAWITGVTVSCRGFAWLRDRRSSVRISAALKMEFVNTDRGGRPCRPAPPPARWKQRPGSAPQNQRTCIWLNVFTQLLIKQKPFLKETLTDHRPRNSYPRRSGKSKSCESNLKVCFNNRRLDRNRKDGQTKTSHFQSVVTFNMKPIRLSAGSWPLSPVWQDIFRI